MVGRSAADWTPDVDLEGLDENRRVSRRHAELAREDGVTRVRDAGSRNGTAVNGTPLRRGATRTLRDGDRISFGGVEAIYLAAAAWPIP
jgi:pSer/pThr/pTyr-binding forkhead associated (FHA) protein